MFHNFRCHIQAQCELGISESHLQTSNLQLETVHCWTQSQLGISETCISIPAYVTYTSHVSIRSKPLSSVNLDAWQHSVIVCFNWHSRVCHPAITDKHLTLCKWHLQSTELAILFILVRLHVIIGSAPRHLCARSDVSQIAHT